MSHDPVSTAPDCADHAQDLIFRPIEAGDYAKGYMDLLSQLTEAGSVSESMFQVSESMFQATLAKMQSCGGSYHIMVAEDPAKRTVVGSATAVIEQKMIHECGRVCHVEDVVVDSAYRGRRIGQRLLEKLDEIARLSGCYKSILDCAESKVAFYEKTDFKRKGVQMAKYYQ